MSINWVKVEEKPEKKQSIEGRVLLDLRAKINDLELKVTQLTNDLNASISYQLHKYYCLFGCFV